MSESPSEASAALGAAEQKMCEQGGYMSLRRAVLMHCEECGRSWAECYGCEFDYGDIDDE